MNIGLLIATMVEVSKKQMSFFNAVVVVNLLRYVVVSKRVGSFLTGRGVF